MKQKQTFSSHSLMTVNIKTNDFKWGKNKVFLIYSRHFAENKYCYCKVFSCGDNKDFVSFKGFKNAKANIQKLHTSIHNHLFPRISISWTVFFYVFFCYVCFFVAYAYAFKHRIFLWCSFFFWLFLVFVNIAQKNSSWKVFI